MAKVLVVDDSASMRQMVAFTLKQAGHEVTEGRDGNDGLGKAQGTKADLVITDVNMPGMDGLQLTRELRKLGDYKFTPILVLTTEAGPEKKQEGKAAGATGWLVKPFDPDQLMNTVNRVLR
ncbi:MULTISPECIES: response regulator [unclassified Thioalkalivibrio]|uniref:response regulator n=1 Tax=unclassified Thioalkalivibrio TaxID=2621013 RepID=UPI000369D3CF|nr:MULTISPECIES: response regulator [unclassified Thioalkalivibrio]